MNDDRLHPHPRIRHNRAGLHLEFAVMPPLRLVLLHEVLYRPLINLWMFVAFCLLIEGTLAYFSIYDGLGNLGINRIETTLAMIALLSTWVTERVCRYPLATAIFGKSIRISISEKHLKIRAGLVSWKNFSRECPLAFAQVPFNGTSTSAYANSMSLVLIIGDARRIKVSEVFNVDYLERIVANTNIALSINAWGVNRSLDPSEHQTGTSRHKLLLSKIPATFRKFMPDSFQ